MKGVDMPAAILELCHWHYNDASLLFCFADVSVADVSVGRRKVSVILGDLVWQEMSHCIIHECLLHSIPTNSSQLEQYSVVCIKR